MTKEKKDKRFELNGAETIGITWTSTIIVDKQTGVNYLFVNAGYGGGLTPLLDANGRIVVSPQEA